MKAALLQPARIITTPSDVGNYEARQEATVRLLREFLARETLLKFAQDDRGSVARD